MLNFTIAKRIYVLIVVGIVGLSACKDSPYLSAGVIPGNDVFGVGTLDTFTIQSFTEPDDSIITTGSARYAIGQITNDATFGKTTASLYAQFALPADQFEGLGTIDSAFLTLDYAGFYGDTATSLTVGVYEIGSSNNIAEGTKYYSSKNFDVSGVACGGKINFKLNSKDSIKINGVNEPPHLRIPIYTASSFLATLASQTSTTGFLNIAAFHAALNGLYIDVKSTNGNTIMFINNNEHTGLTVYHHRVTGTPLTTIFRLNNTSVNHFVHDRSGAIAASHFTNKNDSVIYVEGFAGLRSRIMIPYITNLKNVIINKAEITFEDVNQNTATATLSPFTPPTALYLFRKDSINQQLEDVTSPLANSSDVTYFGGKRSSKSTYTFNIARYLQRVVDGQTIFNGFYLNVLGNGVYPNELILGGGNAVHYKIKMKILLTHIR